MAADQTTETPWEARAREISAERESDEDEQAEDGRLITLWFQLGASEIEVNAENDGIEVRTISGDDYFSSYRLTAEQAAQVASLIGDWLWKHEKGDLAWENGECRLCGAERYPDD